MYMGQLLYVGAALLILAALMQGGQGIGLLASKLSPRVCRPCATFWATAALLFGMLASIGYDWPASRLIEWHAHALVFAFINYFYIKTKIEVYE